MHLEHEFETWDSVLRTWYLGFLVLQTWDLNLGFASWNLEIRPFNMELGTLNLGLGTLDIVLETVTLNFEFETLGTWVSKPTT